ncbi:MAG TPA: hypothetical protein VIW45_07860 [Vicinamibacterales bacterium]
MHSRPRARTFSLRVLVLLPLFAATASHAGAQTKAYVTQGDAAAVAVIDTATGTVSTIVPVGTAPSDVAISRDGARAYVTNAGSDSVSVIDTASDAVVATIAVGVSPSSIAVTPDGERLYVMTANAVVDAVDIAQGIVIAAIPLDASTGFPLDSGSGGGLAVTPDGARVYVAAGHVHVIDTATNTVTASFAAETEAFANVFNTATSVAIAPDGSRVYVGVTRFNTSDSGFSAGGSVAVVDTASNTVASAINIFSLPGPLALTPDGSRLYVAIQSFWANTGYGAAFFPGRMVYVVDTITNRLAAWIDVGADGANWTEQNTPTDIAVTPDRGTLLVSVSRISSVVAADINTNLVTTTAALTAHPGGLAIVPDDHAVRVPYAADAADDEGSVSTAGGTASAGVLANDLLGGLRPSVAEVTLTQQSSSGDGVSLDASTGEVGVAAGTAAGTYSLVYRMCETAAPANCDEGTVAVTVHEPFVIDARDDTATSLPGRTVLASVLANDTLDGVAATTATVTLAQVSSTAAGVSLDAGSGSVNVAVGTTPGTQALTYRICETASPSNCDTAVVTITVTPFPIDARDDSGWVERTGGTAVADVLANDTFIVSTATLANVRLLQVSTTSPGVSLTGSGAVTVASGTPVGLQTLRYRICEIATPSNCDEAAVAVDVRPLQIIAVNDSARASSKVANTALASVLANDWIGGVRATTANVRLSQVSLTPANSSIRLDVTDGSVDVLGKTSSGTYLLTYQICEIAMPSNCGRATATIDLSGK